METERYPLAGNNALIQLVKSRREDQEAWEELRNGDVKPAIDQLSEEDQKRLYELTTPHQ